VPIATVDSVSALCEITRDQRQKIATVNRQAFGVLNSHLMCDTLHCVQAWP
jgi:hypothetical protein